MATRNLITPSLKAILAALAFSAAAVSAQADVIYRFVTLSATGWQGVPSDAEAIGEIVLEDGAEGGFAETYADTPEFNQFDGIVSASFQGISTFDRSWIRLTVSVNGEFLDIVGRFLSPSASELYNVTSGPDAHTLTIWHGSDGSACYGDAAPYDPNSPHPGSGCSFTGYFIGQDAAVLVPEPSSLLLAVGALTMLPLLRALPTKIPRRPS